MVILVTILAISFPVFNMNISNDEAIINLAQKEWSEIKKDPPRPPALARKSATEMSSMFRSPESSIVDHIQEWISIKAAEYSTGLRQQRTEVATAKTAKVVVATAKVVSTTLSQSRRPISRKFAFSFS